MKLKPHPRYALFEAWFRKALPTAVRYEAELYRVAGPRHTTATEIVQGVGAFKGGGRWNPPGVMNVVYLSLAPETAMHEANENNRYYGIPLSKGMPKVTVAVQTAVDLVLDLTDADAALPEPMANLLAEDWRAVMERLDEATTQAMGRAAYAAGIQGLIVPSKPDPKSTNTLVFPQNCGKTCSLEVLNPELLEKLGQNS